MDDQNEYLESAAEFISTALPKFFNPYLELRHAVTTAKRNSNFQLKQHLI